MSDEASPQAGQTAAEASHTSEGTSQEPVPTEASQLASDNTKSDLQTAAGVFGFDSSGKKQDIAERLVSANQGATPRPPERTQDLRDEKAPLLNEFVKVVDGEHAGKVGAFLSVVDYDKATGFPHSVLVRTRDAANELLQVLYDHVRPHRTYKGGR